MSSEGNYVQDFRERQKEYFGSQRNFYLASGIGSTSTWAFVNFSGTNTGFGQANNVVSNRIQIVSSGTSFVQYSFGSGVQVDGELYGGETQSRDGTSVSGLWLRSNASSQGYKIWAW